jgi:hypothetical protein
MAVMPPTAITRSTGAYGPIGPECPVAHFPARLPATRADLRFAPTLKMLTRPAIGT